jgi:tetratricopeptide (TPR) repeat protein
MLRALWRRFGPALGVVLTVVVVLLAANASVALLARHGHLDLRDPSTLVAGSAQRFFRVEKAVGGSLVRLTDPYMAEVRFAVDKPRGTMRIVVLGDSVAMGWPFAVQGEESSGGGDYPNWLAAVLSARYPDRRFEVINAAAGESSVRRARLVGTDLAAFAPDLFILAQATAVLDRGAEPPPPAGGPALVRLARKWFVGPPETARRLDLEPNPGTTALQKSIRHNLRAMAVVADDARAKLLLATLPANVKNAELLTDVDWDDPQLKRGRALQETGDCEGALAVYKNLADPVAAARFGAECLATLGRFDEAAAAYRRAMVLWPRALVRPDLNDVMRDEAARLGRPLVDLDARFSARQPDRVPDPSLFLDFSHLTYTGYFQMALDTADALAETGLLPTAAAPTPPIEQLMQTHGWTALLSGNPRAALPQP